MQPSREGLVGHWPLNEGSGDTAHDLSGNELHGAIHGSTWVKGKENTGDAALEFRPEGTWVEILDDPKLDIVHDITLSAWVYKEQDNTSRKPRWDALISKCPKDYVDPAHIHYELMISGVNPDEVSFFSNSTIPPCGWSGRLVPIAKWVHVAFVRRKNRGQFYLNGMPTDRYRVQIGYDPGHQGEGEEFLVTNIELEGPMQSAEKAQNLYIGWDGTPGYGMEGKISDVYLYQRALNDLEMKALSGL